MLRNLKMRKGVPFKPMRLWRKNTGPVLSSLISTATMSSTGRRTMSPALAIRRSTARFSIGLSAAMAPDNAAQGVGHAVDVVRSQGGEERQRHDALPLRTRLGQPLRAGAERFAVVAVLVQRDEMDAGADPSRGELLDHLVAPDA